MIYKTLKKVSDVCQVLDKSKYHATTTNRGVTFTNNADGTYTVNGTATEELYYIIIFLRDTLYPSHQYLLTGENPGLYLFVENRDKNNKILPQLRHNIIRSLPTDTKKSTFECYIEQGTVCDNLVFKPQLFDLTEMYGVGNEPTTVEQFRQDFPEELYDYKPYCFVKSYKNCLKVNEYCQLLDKSKYSATQTIYGVTFTNNGDGSITVNGTCTNPYYSAYKIKENLDGIISGHKYAILGTDTNVKVAFYASYQGGYIWEVANNIFTLPENEYTGFSSQIRVTAGVSVSNITVKPQIFDLTEMYGVGNEPTTVEQFRQDFPEEMYDYKPYSTIPSYKKSLVCTTKNLLDIDKVFSAPTLCFDVSSLEIGKTYTFSSNKPIMVFKISNIRVGYNSVVYYPSSSGFTTFTFVMARDEYIPVTAKQYLFLWLPELNTTGDINTSGYVTDISQLNGYNLQIELGDTPTDYVPYGHL